MVWQRVYNGLLKALYWFTEDYIALFLWNKPFPPAERKLKGNRRSFSGFHSVNQSFATKLNPERKGEKV
jgi:hypothetical protein